MSDCSGQGSLPVSDIRSESPAATERVVAALDGLVRVILKKPVRDGTVAVDNGPALATLPARRDRAAAAISHRAVCGRPLVAREVTTAGRPHAPPYALGYEPEPSGRHRCTSRVTSTSRYSATHSGTR